tara:strand:+ start:1705 stop:1836 length:132 start_codon:yes stop_codon:yes gene_type:complete
MRWEGEFEFETGIMRPGKNEKDAILRLAPRGESAVSRMLNYTG